MSASELPSRMWAWRKHKGKTEPVLEEVPVPSTPSQGYLIRVLAAGVCHSDHAILSMTMQPPYFNDQFTMGHECCGMVAGIGSDIPAQSLQLGDKVVVLSVPGCGNDGCPECSRGLQQLCLTGEHYGLGQDGSFAEFVAVHARSVVPLPEGVSSMVGAIATDAVLTGYHAVFQRGGIKKDDVVFLFGLGGLGFNALQMMLSLGIRVIVSDVKEDLLEAAVRQGVHADDVVPIGKSPREFLKNKNLEGKIDVVLDIVGLKQTFADAQVLVRRGGTIVVVGALSSETSLNMHLCLGKRISVLFSYGGHREDLVEVLQMLSKGKIQPQVSIERMEDFPQILERLHAGKINGRVALIPKGVESEAALEQSKRERL